MRRFNLRKYCYVFLWLGLVAAVGLVWLWGGRQLPQAESLPLPRLGEGAKIGAAIAPASAPGTQDMAGVWVPYMMLETPEHTQASFEENYRHIVKLTKERGFNALFVHVRPFSDALYPSALFPWSHLLTGEQGKDPGFDPLAFMIQCTHEAGMEFHAWINPLRVKLSEIPAALSPESPYSSLLADSPYYFMESGGAVYLNPAYPYVRGLIAQGAGEIVKNYEVDGIHFDDYFYPEGGEELDKEAYGLYCSAVETPLPLLEWRQANVNALVAQVYQTIKGIKPQVVFGISPQGNIRNDEEMGADVKTWCAIPGYVDYLCPQLYFSYENEALGFTQAVEQWMALPRHKGLALYAGLALYKAGSDADGGTWLQQGDDILQRQVADVEAAGFKGVVLYSAAYLESPQTRAELANRRL